MIRQLGIHDFYSANLMTYCEGYYTPAAVPNATVPASAIKKNVTYCSPRAADFQFDPRAALQRDLDASGNAWLDASADLDWPAQVEDGLRAVHVVQRAAFVIYCVAAGLCGLAAVISLLSVFASSSGRACACGNVLLAALAFLVAVVAAALATAVAEVGARAVNHYGGQVGIAADAGHRFMGLAWGAAGAMLVCLVWWSVDCCCCCCGGRRDRRPSRRGWKAGVFGRNEKMGKYDSATSV